MRRPDVRVRLASRAVRKEIPLVLVVLAFASGSSAVVACSSSSSQGTGGTVDASTDGKAASDSGGGSDAGSDGYDPLNCVPPGTPNNAAGVGGYCTKGGNECAIPDGGPTICTADFPMLVPPHAWFCTDLCSPDAAAVACGNPGPPCIQSAATMGMAVCLPPSCQSFLNATDGGSTD
jgi:hypothetical protein